MKPAIDIITAVQARDVFGPWFRNSTTWSAWFCFLKVLFGLALDDTELAIFQKHTGRDRPAPGGYHDVTLIIGRRGGKSIVLALIAAFLAVFVDWRPYLNRGQSGTIIIVAADKKQATVTLGYLREMLGIPLIAGSITRETAELVELSTGIVIEVVTANYKTIRGRTVVCALCDELAFWPADGASSPDKEIIAALRPAMATVPGAQLLKASSPYARRGVLWNDYAKHFGKDDSTTLVWQAATRDMNPSVPEGFIQAAYEDDPASAAAEYGAAFRTDVESFVSREVVESCVIRGRYELPPMDSITYYGFCDPSGGSSDSMTLAISHREGEHVVIDAIREFRPPFSPEQTVSEFAALLKIYRINSVVSDRYAGEWVRERFRAHNVECIQAAKPKSDLYKDMLPVLNSGRVELLDHTKAISQICSLERRTARGGRDSIDHPPGAHDDLCNAIAGAIFRAAIPQGGAEGWLEFYRRLSEETARNRPDVRVRVHVPPDLELSTIYGISGSTYIVEMSSDGRRTAMMTLDDAKALVCSPMPSACWRKANPDL
jgi:hypothetical protein